MKTKTIQVLEIKNNASQDIFILRWDNNLHMNGAADVQFIKGFKDGRKVVNIAVQLRDKKTKLQPEGDSDDIQLTCSKSISLLAFDHITTNRGKFKASKEAKSMMIGRFPTYFYQVIDKNGDIYYGCNVVMGDADKSIYRKFHLDPYLNVVLEKEIVPEFTFEPYNVEHNLAELTAEEE